MVADATTARRLVDAGVRVVGVQAAVTLRVAGGAIVHPDEALTVEAALAAYTRTAAEALGVADQAGVPRGGAAADLVELCRPPSRRYGGYLPSRTPPYRRNGRALTP
ncbi:amidohydrolase family protein [Micromonospora radicis]|uniref:Amidohydrolase 3 domain-containing protein n=1 Tax=Micromonospora radicis TaxID=1894971 RepID=A0A418MZK6_9ACTN|nr:amidohydrolase family protein [Micromonospora radicis]RIV40225.1 hypothetical protein D2L64_05040 [Micromonospora radicis]